MNRIGVARLEDALAPFDMLRAGSNPHPLGERIAKLDFVTLSGAKGLCAKYRILPLRQAQGQNDRGGDASFAIVCGQETGG